MKSDANSNTTPSAVAEPRDWTAAPLSELIAHIVSIHHQYLKVELPKIQKRLQEVYATHRERHAATLAPLPGIFFLLTDELRLHMHKEERTLFPAIEESEQVAKGGYPPAQLGTLANPIFVMLAEHESVESSLEQIRRITRDYKLPPHACDPYQMLFLGFEALEREIQTHFDLENKILFPRALALQP